MTKVYLVMAASMEPYCDYTWAAKAFTTLGSAEKYFRENEGVQGEGHIRWDDASFSTVPCEEGHEDAEYQHGWFCFDIYTMELEE
jgi:hypothetical protein